MKPLKALIAVAGLLLAACSDTTSPNAVIDPSFKKGNGGGIGDPHFEIETVCTFSDVTGRLACDYKLAGLASGASGAGLLQGNVITHWFCNYPGTSKDYYADKIGLDIDFLYLADKSGNATGHVEGTPEYIVPPYCVPKIVNFSLVMPTPSGMWYELNEYAYPLVLPGLPAGGWSLSAGVVTPKGGLRYVYFGGEWIPEVVQ
jgi:hypothetical protein